MTIFETLGEELAERTAELLRQGDALREAIADKQHQLEVIEARMCEVLAVLQRVGDLESEAEDEGLIAEATAAPAPGGPAASTAAGCAGRRSRVAGAQQHGCAQAMELQWNCNG